MRSTLLLAVAALVAALPEAPDTVDSVAMLPVTVGALSNASNTSQNASNLCLFNNGGCDVNAVCTPTEDGSDVTCACGPHYTGDGHNCTKRTGCFPGKCCENARCVEAGAAESAACVCNLGFEAVKQTAYVKAVSKVVLKCIPVNPCRTMNGGCANHASCLPSATILGERICRCNQGYAGEGEFCTEIDACTPEQNRGNCSANATCDFISPGQAKCSCNLHFAGDGLTCNLINPCDSMHDCNANAECVDLKQGFSTCQCKEKWFGEGGKNGVCKPKNACDKLSVHQSDCHAQATCSYVAPARHGCTCNKGYEGNGLKTGNPSGKVATGCAVSNPCDHNFGGCDKRVTKGVSHSTCELIQPAVFDASTQSMKAHKCTCTIDHLDIFKNGFKCEEINYCINNNNVEGMPLKGGCHKNAFCVHLGPRKYECKCQPGYKGDGRGCFPDDFCMMNHGGCHPTGANCFYDGPGAHRCKCKPGWSGDGKNCARTCAISDADCEHGGRFSGDCSCTDCARPWYGPTCKMCNESALSCGNGGSFSSQTCACENCNAPFGGETCDTCTLSQQDCKNGGTLNRGACACDCGTDSPWTGSTCETCSRTETRTAEQVCMHQGTFAAETCSCETCPFPWAGPLCNMCARTNADCNSGTMNMQTCKCDDCTPGMGGDRCEKCIKTEASCGGKGSLNKALCQCENCIGGWMGTKCDECKLTQDDCQEGTLNMALCKCVGCNHNRDDGYVCSTCKTEPTQCQNGGILNTATCKCACKPPFKGEFCSECGIEATECKGDGKLNATTCQCSNCTVVGASDLCSVCSMKQSQCKNGGKLNPKTCSCQSCFPYKGKECSVCSLIETDCRHGSVLDSMNCRCVKEGRVPMAGASCTEKLKQLKAQSLNQASVWQAGCNNHKWGDSQACYYTETAMGESVCKECKNADPQFAKCPKTHTLCPTNWGGITCNNCMRNNSECGKNGIIDPKTCQCRCNSTLKWGGVKCDICQRDATAFAEGCENSAAKTFDTTNCNCTKCKSVQVPLSGKPAVLQYKGDNCKLCALQQTDCKNEGVLSEADCKCHLCKNNHSGVLCEHCDLTPANCKNGASLVNCKCQCLEGFTGKMCEKKMCPLGEGQAQCSDHGSCERSNGMAVCRCNTGYAGAACERAQGPEYSSPCFTCGMKHTTTFDGMSFEDFDAGEYVMYADVNDPFQEKIHVLQGHYNRKAGIYGIAIRRNASVNPQGSYDTVKLIAPQMLAPHAISRSSKAAVQYGCDYADSKGKSYTSLIAKAGTTGYEFPNGVIITRANGYQYQIKTPSGLSMVVDSFYNADVQFFNTYLAIKGEASATSIKGYCGNFNNNKKDDERTVPVFGGMNSVFPGAQMPSVTHNGMKSKSLFSQCEGDALNPVAYAEGETKAKLIADASQRFTNAMGGEGASSFADFLAELKKTSPVEGSGVIEAREFCVQHRLQVMEELERARGGEAGYMKTLAYWVSNSGYLLAWNTCSKVCEGKYQNPPSVGITPTAAYFREPKNAFCRACIIDQCSQMDAVDGPSTVQGNVARCAASVKKFTDHLR